MDQLLQMLQSADPSDDQPDLPELLHLEGKKMSWVFFVVVFLSINYLYQNKMKLN